MLSQDSIEKLANHLRAEGTPESHALLTQIQTELEQDARRQELSVQVVNSVLNLLVQFGHPEAKVGDTLRDLLDVQSWSSVMPSEEDISATGLVSKVLYALEAYHEHQFDASIDALAEAVQIFRILWGKRPNCRSSLRNDGTNEALRQASAQYTGDPIATDNRCCEHWRAQYLPRALSSSTHFMLYNEQWRLQSLRK